MLSLAPKSAWKPPIVITSAARQEGIDELWAAIESHRKHLESTGKALARAVQRLKDETAEVAAEIARDRARQALADGSELSQRLLEDGTPYDVAEEILRIMGQEP
jgi:LAO/AO transport system kinase